MDLRIKTQFCFFFFNIHLCEPIIQLFPTHFIANTLIQTTDILNDYDSLLMNAFAYPWTSRVYFLQNSHRYFFKIHQMIPVPCSEFSHDSLVLSQSKWHRPEGSVGSFFAYRIFLWLTSSPCTFSFTHFIRYACLLVNHWHFHVCLHLRTFLLPVTST